MGSNSADVEKGQILGREGEVTGLTHGLEVESEEQKGARGTSEVLIRNDYKMVTFNRENGKLS